MAWQSKLARLRAEVRGWSDWVLLGRILLLAAFLPGLLRYLSLPALMRTMTPVPSRHRSGAIDPDKIVRLTGLVVERAPLIRKTCLIRSLVLYRLLRTGGVPVQIHLGVQQAGSRLAGHSWLTYEGRPFSEPPAEQAFSEIYVYPPEANLLARPEAEEPSACA